MLGFHISVVDKVDFFAPFGRISRSDWSSFLHGGRIMSSTERMSLSSRGQSLRIVLVLFAALNHEGCALEMASSARLQRSRTGPTTSPVDETTPPQQSRTTPAAQLHQSVDVATVLLHESVEEDGPAREKSASRLDDLGWIFWALVVAGVLSFVSTLLISLALKVLYNEPIFSFGRIAPIPGSIKKLNKLAAAGAPEPVAAEAAAPARTRKEERVVAAPAGSGEPDGGEEAGSEEALSSGSDEEEEHFSRDESSNNRSRRRVNNDANSSDAKDDAAGVAGCEGSGRASLWQFPYYSLSKQSAVCREKDPSDHSLERVR